MPTAVACPVCGVDGTAAADAAIAQSMPKRVTVVAAPAAPGVAAFSRSPAPSLPIRQVAPAQSAPTASPRRAALLPGQIDPAQAEHEARAKILWGDPPDAVVKYLMIQRFSYEEASRLVRELFRERAVTIRRNGIKKTVIGVGLMCVPVVAFIIFTIIGVLPLKLFGATLVVGVWGAWMVLKGTIMFLAPKSEPGDVAEQ
ncbi:MAG TPA: hypothetical protein VJW76_06560 [Verrucomicrobiae bacterium]|nr:hypothetical protein [Verrucomicrobiae bacterium]